MTYSVFSLFGVAVALFSQVHVAEPNWSKPHYHPEAITERDQILKSTPASKRMEFSFTLPSYERTTSAAVYDSSGKKIRTLWMDRTYEKGTYHDVWDGRDDYGHEMAMNDYRIRVSFNNVSYTWEGLIGNTESSWSSFRTWDGVVSSFIRSLAFMSGNAYSANGYNEGGYAAAAFNESAPNSNVYPLTKLIFSTLQHFMFATTDGRLLYFGFQTYSADRYPSQGVIAFYPSGEYYRFPEGSPYPSFPQNTATFWNDATIPPIGIPDVRAVGISPYPSSAVTGVAVERNGRLLATAHGYYKPGGAKSMAVSSANEIRLWDKSTGKVLGRLSVPNPQGMAFDLQNNLWVISGYGTNDRLFRVSDVGKDNRIDSPIRNLSNPISVSVSPSTGSLFVADGGTSQQVKEFNTTTGQLISSLGTEGGYMAGGDCKSTVSNNTFWFDPGPKIRDMRYIGINSPFVSWVSIGENGDVWVGDFSTSRVLHFAWGGNKWKYINRIMYLPWSYDCSVPFGRPTRVFGGQTGFLEFKIDYSVPLRPGDPELESGPHSWELVRNWLPCFASQYPELGVSAQMEASSFRGGDVFGTIWSDALARMMPILLKLNETGKLESKSGQLLPQGVRFDSDGNYYVSSVEAIGVQSVVSVKKYGVSGYDLDGFPKWYPVGQLIGRYVADHRKGDAVPREPNSTYWPSSNFVIPVFDTSKNFDIPAGTGAFHLGGLHVGGNRLEWQTMPEKDIKFTDGEGTFPSADVRGRAAMGINAWAMDDNIFAFQNGNGSPWSCQFYHFKDNGLFVGQFGFQTSPDYPPTNISWKVTGFPQQGTEQPLAPGECSDEGSVKSVRVGNDYYLYLGDEGYHRGLHRWKVSNLGSYGEIQALAKLGGARQIILGGAK